MPGQVLRARMGVRVHQPSQQPALGHRLRPSHRVGGPPILKIVATGEDSAETIRKYDQRVTRDFASFFGPVRLSRGAA